MSKHFALRLYFHHSARVRPSRFWHKVARPSLASHLLKKASEAGIHQVVMHHVKAGYLPGDKLSRDHSDIRPHKLPHCIELIDLEHRLREFLAHHGEHLENVRAVFFPCEINPQGT
ncbi:MULTISPECIES: DUF190 domain-containing protein [unclassified Pandoraea]|uniref:DUF190 domain-containing protein n=1 Tax=unclassified Pandoraea TaxID=2624094 RepID=UPI0012F818B2|nr:MULTISPECIES: DUF190 domain-containing protein [unclassified Pandoraea]